MGMIEMSRRYSDGRAKSSSSTVMLAHACTHAVAGVRAYVSYSAAFLRISRFAQTATLDGVMEPVLAASAQLAELLSSEVSAERDIFEKSHGGNVAPKSGEKIAGFTLAYDRAEVTLTKKTNSEKYAHCTDFLSGRGI